MRHTLLPLAVLSMLAGIVPAAAQEAGPAASQPAAESCNPPRAEALRRHEAAEQARLAADPAARPRGFTFVCYRQPTTPPPEALPVQPEFLADDNDDDDWGISDFTARQAVAERAACGNNSDLLAAQSTSRPRYDANGALIREAPSAACAPPGSRYGALSQSVRAEEQRREQAAANSGSAFLRQPDCEETATGYRCASSGSAGRNTYAREQQCEETATGRSCSSTFSIGSSEEGRNAAQEELERMLRD